MKYRIAELLDEESVSGTGTKTIDINVSECISRIGIRYKVTKGEAGGGSAHPAADITRIELVDGSDVLHSTTGYENEALCIYDREVPTMMHGQQLHNNSIESSYGLDFGRHLWDEQLALDPAKFKNLQLKVSYTTTNCSAAGTSAVLEVFGYLFDEKVPTPVGFLMSKEHHDYTCGSENSYEYVDLPTDYPIRQMLVRAYYAATEPWAQIKEVRLSEDNLKRTVFDWKTEEYHRFMKGVWKPVVEMLYGYCTTSATNFYITPTDYFASVVAMPVDNLTLYGPRATGGKTIIQGSSVAYFLAHVHGYLPLHCFQFPFGVQSDLDDWYDVTQKGSVRLRLKAGSSGTSGTGQVILQQMRNY